MTELPAAIELSYSPLNYTLAFRLHSPDRGMILAAAGLA